MPLAQFLDKIVFTQEDVEAFIDRAQKAIVQEVVTHPFHVVVEAIFILALIFMVVAPRKYHVARDEKLTKEEEKELVDAFTSERLAVPELPDNNWRAPMACRNDGTRSDIIDWTGEKFENVINTANFDFLAFSTHPKMIEQACDTTVEYGIGSCGPRGFYGSLKPHIQLEQDVAAFLNSPSCIVYACSFASPATVLPCFAARGDEVICDEAANVLNQHACSLSRASVTYYRHNDVQHVEELMKASHARQRKSGKQLPRRWIVTEGLFRNTGEIAPVDKLVQLAKKYKFRVMIDDNVGFGVLGEHGRGVCELLKVPLSDVDIYLGSFAGAVGSVGGFCVGTEMVTDHQRLGATGYVFSAAACAYASTCASLAIKMLGDNTSAESQRPKRVQNLAKLFRSKVQVPSSLLMYGGSGSSANAAAAASVTASSVCDSHTATHSPIIVFRRKVDVTAVFDNNKGGGLNRFAGASESFRKVEDAIIRRGFLVTRVEFNHEERISIAPTLRINLKSEMSEVEVAQLAAIVSEELKKEFSS